MTQPATPLPPFEGQAVLSSQIAIVKAGDGLSEALQLEPKAYAMGQEIHLIIKAKIAHIDHRPIKDTDTLIRLHTANAIEATEVSEEDVAAYLLANRERVALARDRVTGQQNLLDKEAEDAEIKDMAPSAREERAAKRGHLHVESDD